MYVCMYVCMCACRRVKERDAKSRCLNHIVGRILVKFCPQQSYQKEAVCPSIQVFWSKTMPKKRVQKRDANTQNRSPKTTSNFRANSVPLFNWGASRYLTRNFCRQTLKLIRQIPLKPLFFQVCPPPFASGSVQTRCTNSEHMGVPLRLLQRILVCHFRGGGPKRFQQNIWTKIGLKTFAPTLPPKTPELQGNTFFFWS